MIVRSLADLDGSDRDVHAPTWKSRRFLLAEDGMGFSLHDTVIYAGTETEMEYRHHLEAVYCIEGDGLLTDVDNDATYPISAGTMYALDGNERHIVKARTTLRMVCVFNPPCTGDEVHDETGAYPAPEDMKPGV